MKSSWKTQPLGELCEFQRGLTYAKGDEVAVSDNVVLRATNIDLTTNLLNFDDLKFINDRVVVPYSKKVKKGSLMICTASGSKSHLGKVAYIDDDYNYAFGGFMGMITPKNGLNSKYLFHLMTSPNYKDFIDELSDGANINNLRFDDLKEFPIPHPNPEEQERIVSILNEAFDGIAAAKANAEKNLQNARAIFDSHLQSALAKGGQAWESRPLVSICELFVDSAHRTPKYQEEGIPALRPRDVVNGELNLERAMRVSEDEYVTQTKRYTPQPGDIVYSRELSYGWAVLLPRAPRVCLSQGMCLFRPSPKLDPSFLIYVLNSSLGRKQATQAAVGTAHPHINLGDIKSYRIPLPRLEVQRQIRLQLDALAVETQLLTRLYERKLAALEALKKSLLHQAFTGEL